MKLFFIGITLMLTTAIQAWDDKSDTMVLQGTWTLASAELAGNPFLNNWSRA